MQVTVAQIGNSIGITIPSQLRKKHGFRKGQKLALSENAEGDIVIRDPRSVKHPQDFKKWLDVFMKENAEILDELATR